MKLKNWVIYYFYIFSSTSVYGISVERQLESTAKKGQKLMLAMMPIIVLSIAYLYYRGKSEARERMEQFIIASILVATAFGFKAFF